MKRLVSYFVVSSIAGVAAYVAFFALYPSVKEWMGLEWHPAAFTAYFVSLGATVLVIYLLVLLLPDQGFFLFAKDI